MKRNQFFNILTVQKFKDRDYSKVEPCLKKNWRFYNAWKLCDLALNNDPKMSGHVDKTTRLQYDSGCISYTQLRCLHPPLPKHQYPPRRLKIQKKHSIQNRSTCCFGSETLLSYQVCSQYYGTRWNCAMNSSLSPDHFFTKIGQFPAPKWRLNFYFGELKCLQSIYSRIRG